jgi:predicted permease
MDTLRQDLRFAWRTFLRAPIFTVTAVVSIGLGIGATTAVYSILDAVLLRPLAVEDPDRLATFGTSDQPASDVPGTFSFHEYGGLRKATSVLSGLAVFAETTVPSAGSGQVFEGVVQFVNADYFRTLGVAASLGQVPVGIDDVAIGRHPMVVLSDRCWRRRLSADSQVLGRSVRIGDATFTVVGVTPPNFRGLDLTSSPDFFVPITMAEAVVGAKANFYRGSAAWLTLVGRLSPGVSRAQAEDVVSRARDEGDGSSGTGRRARVRLMPVSVAALSGSQSQIQLAGWMLLGVAATCLLMACANLIVLLLARGERRVKEIGTRAALGAGRRRLVRQLVTENVLLSAIGGLVGLLVAHWTFFALRAYSLPGGVSLESLSLGALNSRTLLAAFVLTLSTVVLFGITPALRTAQDDVVAALQGGRSVGRRDGGRRVLLAGQLALCLPLLVAMGLFVRQLRTMLRFDFGFDTKGLITATLRGSDPRSAEVLSSLPEEVRRWPGVTAVAVAREVATHEPALWCQGRKHKLRDRVYSSVVEPEYFRVLGLQLVRGRLLDAIDHAGGAKVTVVNESLARALWPGEEALGRWISAAKGGTAHEVVGIVRDAHLTKINWQKARLCYYLPWAQRPDHRPDTLIVRAREPVAVMSALSTRLRAEAPEALLGIAAVSEMPRRRAQNQFVATMFLSAFGAVGVVLAAVGLYGATAYSVEQRTRETGVRLALGATPRQIVALFMRRGLAAVSIGVPLGVVASLWVTTTLRASIYVNKNTPLVEPVALGTAVAILAGAALLASWIPARGAGRLDPLHALRNE